MLNKDKKAQTEEKMEKENIDSLDNTTVQPNTSIRKELTERDGDEGFTCSFEDNTNNDTLVEDSLYSCDKISDSDASNAQQFLEMEDEANLFNNEGCSSECNPIILSVRGNVTDEDFNSLNDEIDMDVLDKEDNLPVKRGDTTACEKMENGSAAATYVSSMPATSILQTIMSKVCSTKSSNSLLATSNPKVSTGSGPTAVTKIVIKRPYTVPVNILKVGRTSAPSRLRNILPASSSSLENTSSNALKGSTVDITNNLPTFLDFDGNTPIFNSTTQLDEAYYSSVVDRIFLHASWHEGMTRQEVLKDASPSLILPQKARRENVDKQFVCSVCNYEFYLEEYLNHHMERKVFVLAYYCKKCRRKLTFYNKCTLWQHLRREYPEGFSEEDFESENSYFNLKPYVHEEKSDNNLAPLLPRIKCKFCSKNFLSTDEERKHYTRLDSLQPLLSCHQCLKLIGNSCALSAHLTIHKANSQDVVCPECAVTIKRSDGLKGVFDHLDSCYHFNIGYAISCQCGKAFISSSALKIHMLKCHTKLLLRCHLCQSCFSSLDLISKHCKEFHNISPLPSKVVLCVMCSNGFETHVTLKAHIEKHADGVIAARKRFFCFLCQKDFNCSTTLDNHIEKDHSHRPKRCTICFGLFESRQSLVQHIMSKSCTPENLPVKLHECLDMIVKQDEVIDVNFYKKFFKIPTSKSLSVIAATDKNANVLDKSKTSGDTNVSKNSSGQSNTPNFKNSSGQSNTPNFKNSSGQSNTPNLKNSSGQSNTPNLSVCLPVPVREKRKYQCHSCKICLVGSQNYSQHMALHHSKGLVRNHTNCGICRKTIDDTLIESHMKSHQRRGIIVCAFCHSRNFASMNDALQHIKNLCNYKTVENDGATCVKSNESENVDVSDASCEVIEEERDSKQGGQSESETTSQEESSVFPCLMCGLTFSSKQAKEDHVTRVHDGTRTIYLCSLCDKKGIRKYFSKKNVINKHISHKHRVLDPADIANLIQVEEQNVTSGHVVPTELHQLARDSPAPKRLRLATEDDFLCGKCGFSTGDSKTFAEHIVVHNPNKEPQCPECGLCFTVLTGLKKHLFIVHKIKEMNDYLEKRGLLEPEVEEEEEEDCADVLIVDSYVTSNGANTTIVNGTTRNCEMRKKSSSGNRYECNVCYRKFPIEALLKTHMRTHGMAFIRSKRYDDRHST